MRSKWNRPGRIGVWASDFRFGDPGFVTEAAEELEELGYSAIWFPGGRGGDLMDRIDLILAATKRCVIATGILNIWMHEPDEVGAWWRDLDPAQRERIMLGLGVGHAPSIGDAWRQPLTKMAGYLDGLDGEGVPAASRCIAALGPRMLDLARDRSAGAHPYLVPPEHTAIARERLGASSWLAPEQGVVLETDPGIAREIARAQLATYARLPNYRQSWQRLGFGEDEIDAMSDRLIDALFVWGSPETIAERLAAHLKAGADHVCLQVVLGATGASDPAALRRVWRELAPGTLTIGG
jgi:probable F420-dependent oxidoreductase